MLLFAGAAHAQDYGNFAQQYAKLVSQASDINALDERLFGDQVSLYTGGLSFSHTDLSLPGSGFPMAVTRSFKVQDRGGNNRWALGAFGDWDLELPRLHGVFPKTAATASGWTMRYSPLRCGGSTDPYEAMPPLAIGEFDMGLFDAYEYWEGNHFSLPGGGDQELMLVHPGNSHKPSDPSEVLDYRWVTNSQWFFSCLPGTANGFAGDAFLARGPDGSKIWFNYLAKRATSEIRKRHTFPPDTAVSTTSSTRLPQDGSVVVLAPVDPDLRILSREENELLPTRIEDRFGNALVFDYDPAVNGRLLSVQASDGRTITFSYNSTGQIASVSDGTRTWTYTYTTVSGATGQPPQGYTLSQVQLPDLSTWQFGLLAMAKYNSMSSSTDEPDTCNNLPPPVSGNAVGTVTHPSGAVGTFTVKALRHARSYVTKHCVQDAVGVPLVLHAMYPRSYFSPTVISKQVSGPGLPSPSLWTYSYDSGNLGSWAGDCGAGCVATTWTQVRGPSGEQQRYTFGNRFRTDEGRLYRTQTSQVSTVGGVETVTLLRDEQTSFVMSATGQAFPAAVGQIVHARGDHMAALLQPVQQNTLTQQGVNFVRLNNGFDAFANPTSVTRSSVGSAGVDGMRTEQTTYTHDTARWIIGQVDTVTCSGTVDCTPAKQISRTDYDPVSRLPIKTYGFGLLKAEFGYDASGNVSWAKDGRGNQISLSSWYRGVPGQITFPGVTATTMSAGVSPIGWVTSVVDQTGAKTCYGYDPIGRLNLVTYPSEAVTLPNPCDTSTWASTSRSFVKVASVEYGIAAGHWKQTVQTGNGRTTTFYDAQWRPVLVLTEDTANAATRSFVVNRYDASGRRVFSSYPVASLVAVTDALTGARTSYDVLGRVTQVQQDTGTTPAASVLNTNTSYLSGFRTQVTNPRGFATTTAYQTYDSPSTDLPARIELPEGVTSTITRQIALGKPTAIKREGLYVGSNLSAIRSYVYDDAERLCETVEPESGATIVTYDASDNVDWSADGQVSTGTTAAACNADRLSVTAANRITRTYDAMNRELTRTTVAATSNVVTTYYPDGQVNTLVASNPGGNNITSTYTYNKRRLLTREVLQVNANTPWTFDYAYNASSHLATQTYPGSLVVGYAPDGLGRPTQAGTFASSVTYYPNGAVAGFTYGNGIVHTMTQNARKLPARSLDAFGATKFLDDTYAYDGNGNVLSMADAAGTGLNSRTWGVAAPTLYDGLDRLLSVRGTNWGTLTGSYNALYSYDPLDNIRSAKIGASGYTHAYDLGTPSNTNRLVSMQLNGGTTYALVTDATGNITSDARTSHGYQFDAAHRLNAVTGPGAESYLYDGNGRRARTLNSTTGTIEYFGYGADGRLLADWSNRRQVRNQYIYLGNTLVGLNEVSIINFTVAPRYKHTDALGSPVATTDSARNITGRTVYTPYGIPMTPVDGVGYTGHFNDVGTGLTYMQQRYYDPGVGRFLSVDPANAGFNLYNYANNNPYKFIDPDGRVATLGTVTVTGSRPPSEYDYYSPEAKARRNQEGRDILKWFGGPFAAAGSHIVDGEYWSAGFEAAGFLPFIRLTKGVEVFEAARDINKATKSTMALGQKMHKLYKADVADGIARIKEFRLPSGKRIDYIDIEKGVIYELKPNNARSIREGLKQLQGYLDEVKSMPQFQGIQWKTVLETY